MTKSNDAISTWSGFNYQGKTTILCTLMKINELLEQSCNINDYFVELEKFEDFVIYEESKAIALYQVKATLSKKTANGYTDAVVKIKDHRTALKNDDAECFLICPMDVKNWDSNLGVNLLRYNGNLISLTDVVTSIQNEINRFFLLNKTELVNDEFVYLSVCNLIDEKVSITHRNGRSSDYKICFSDFVDCMIKSNNNIGNVMLLWQKEQVYNHVINTIEGSLTEYCIESCDKEEGFSHSDCNNTCGAKQHFDDIINIDILKYCEIINPDSINIGHAPLKFVELMPGRDYRRNIYDVFKNSKLQDIENDGSLSYIRDNIFNSKKEKIIPTLLNFNNVKSIGIALEQISRNDNIKPYIEGNVLTAEAQGVNTTISQCKITFIDDEGYEKELSKTTNYKFDTMILDKRIYFNKLGDIQNVI